MVSNFNQNLDVPVLDLVVEETDFGSIAAGVVAVALAFALLVF